MSCLGPHVGLMRYRVTVRGNEFSMQELTWDKLTKCIVT